MFLRHRKPLHVLLYSNALRPFMPPNPHSLPLVIPTTNPTSTPLTDSFCFISPQLQTPNCSLSHNLSFFTHATIPRPVPQVYLEKPDDDDIVEMPQLKQLKSKLKEIRLVCGHFGPGQTTGLLCPMCKGGESKEKSLALLIAKDGNAAVWNCFRAKCGWAGSTRGSADVMSSYNRMNKITPKVKNI